MIQETEPRLISRKPFYDMMKGQDAKSNEGPGISIQTPTTKKRRGSSLERKSIIMNGSMNGCNTATFHLRAQDQGEFLWVLILSGNPKS